MQGVFGTVVNVLGSGGAGVALEVVLADGSVAVEKRAKTGDKIAASLLRAEAGFLDRYKMLKGVIRKLGFRETADGPALLLEKAEGGSLRLWLSKNGPANALQTEAVGRVKFFVSDPVFVSSATPGSPHRSSCSDVPSACVRGIGWPVSST